MGEKTREPESAAPPVGRARRLDSIDLLRGVIMVVMALDHVRDYWHHDSLVPKNLAIGINPIDPVNLDETNGWLFLTRWVTHFCAPTFVFLAGTGAYLYGSRGRSTGQLAWFLLSRGLWLIVADMTLSRLGWAFYLWGPDGQGHWWLGGGILWVIGAAMVLLAGLVFLPTSAIVTFGVALIVFHNLLDGKSAAELHLPQWIWGILHDPKGGNITDNVSFGVSYGLLPCLGIMAAGYGLGALYLLDSQVRRRQLLGLGCMVTLVFVALRFSNLYGDPASPQAALPGPWSQREPWCFTISSFLNCQKYPMSLLFTLMTLGPGIILLGLFEWTTGQSRLARFLIVFGRVPFFFYVLHVPLIHGLAVGLDYLRFHKSPLATDGCWSVAGSNPPADYGVSLPVVYLVWVAVVVLLYPLCWWFAGIKRRYRWAWLSYL